MRRMNCKSCQGDGLVFRNARIVHGLVTAVNPGKDKQLIEAGYLRPGDCVFSPSLSDYGTIADFDKVTMQFPVPLNDGTVIMRGAAHLDENAHIDTDLQPNEDRLWYLADCAIWCEDENGVAYTANEDYVFEGRKLRWVGKSPDVGTIYTVKYMGYPEWIVFVQPFQRFDNNRNLAPKVLLRKKHVAVLTGSKAATPAERTQEQAAFVTKVKI